MKTKQSPVIMNTRFALSLAALLTLGTTARADIFDTNSTASGFGVTNGSTYDWWTANFWSDGTAAANDAGTAATVTWQGTAGVSEAAFFVGSGTAGQNYTVRLGGTGATDTYIGNLALNVKADGSAGLSGAAGNVTIGTLGDTGILILRAANSVGAHNSGTLTLNNLVNLNGFTMNHRGGNVVINGAVSGTGASNINLASGAFGLTSGTLTLAGDNSYAGNTSVASGYTLNLQHANALGATGGGNSVASGGILQISSGTSIVSGESVTIHGGATDFFGSLRAGSGGGTWGGQVTLGDASVRIGALAAQTLTITGGIVNGVGTGFNVSTQSGTGVVVLNPTTSNSYTGTTGIIRGILRLGKTDALPTGTTLDVDSVGGVSDAATFDLAGFSQTVAVLQDTAGSNINGKITNSAGSTTSTLTVNQASNSIYDGIIENGGGSVVLTKSGVGNLTLNGPNTYTGGTNIQNGKIIIGAFNDRLATGGSVYIGSVANTGALVLGDGTARNQTLAGLTTTGLGGAVVGGAAANSTLTLNIASGINTFGGLLGGGGTNENNLALIKNGAGMLNLTGPNTYGGPTTLTQGTLQIGVDPVGAITSSAIGTGTLTFNGGTLSSDGGTARTIGNTVTFTGNAGLGDATNNGKLTFTNNMDLGAATRTLTVNSAVQLDGSFTNSAAASGLIKAGAGTLTINAANTSFGNTNGFAITGGTVVAAHTAAMGNAGQIVMLSSDSGFGTLDLATTTTANAYALLFGGVTGVGGNVLVNRADPGDGDATTHTMGTASMGNAKVNVSAGGNVTSGTPTLELAGVSLVAGVTGDGATTLIPTTAKILVSGPITRTGASANSLVLDGTSTGNLISGAISGPQTLTKSNISTWELSNANTFTGKTLVSGGTLKLTNNLAIQNSAFDTSGAGTLDITTINTPTFGGVTSATSYVLPANVTGLTLNPNSGTQTYTGNLSGGAAGLTLTKSGAGAQVLGGTSGHAGLTTVGGGILTIGNSGALGTTAGDTTVISGAILRLANGMTVTGETILIAGAGGSNFNGSLQADASATAEWAGTVKINSADARVGAGLGGSLKISGAIVDNAGFNILNIGAGHSGAGEVIVSAASGTNTYTGNTTITRGTLKLGADNTLPTGTTLDVDAANAAENAIFDLNGFNQTVAGLQRTNTSGGSGGAIITNSGAADKTLTIIQGATTVFSGVIQDGGSNKTILVKDGAGNLTLSGLNTYLGGTRIDAGTLTLGHATNTLADGGAVNVNGGTLALGASSDIVGAVTLTTGSITGAGTLTGTGGNFDVRSGSVSAKLGGAVGLDKTTVGTVTLSGDNEYTGDTTVSGGVLRVNGLQSGSGLISVSAGSTLGGSGSVVGDVSVADATLSPGAAAATVGTLTMLNLSLTPASTLDFDLAAPFTNDGDLLSIVGNLAALAGTLTVSPVAGFDAPSRVAGDKWLLASYGGAALGSHSLSVGTAPLLGGGLSYAIDISQPNEVYLTVVPEAGTAGLLGAGLLLLARLLRRR